MYRQNQDNKYKEHDYINRASSVDSPPLGKEKLSNIVGIVKTRGTCLVHYGFKAIQGSFNSKIKCQCCPVIIHWLCTT